MNPKQFEAQNRQPLPEEKIVEEILKTLEEELKIERPAEEKFEEIRNEIKEIIQAEEEIEKKGGTSDPHFLNPSIDWKMNIEEIRKPVLLIWWGVLEKLKEKKLEIFHPNKYIAEGKKEEEIENKKKELAEKAKNSYQKNPEEYQEWFDKIVSFVQKGREKIQQKIGLNQSERNLLAFLINKLTFYNPDIFYLEFNSSGSL